MDDLRPTELLQQRPGAEAFNLLNFTSFGTPTHLNFTNTADFGQITYARNNARLGQFAPKFSY